MASFPVLLGDPHRAYGKDRHEADPSYRSGESGRDRAKVSGQLFRPSAGKKIDAQTLQEDRRTLLQQDDILREEHMSRVAKGECSSRMTAGYNNLLTSVSRIGNSCVNIADFASQRVDFSALLQEPEE